MKTLVRLFLLMSITLFISCKKEKKDTEDPQLTMYSPANGTTFNMFDTIKIQAQFTDNVELSSISISLRDLNGISVQPSGTQALSGASRTYSTNYILYEYRIKTGDYNLELLLSDGENTTTKTIPIHIIESPTYLKGFYLAQGDNTSSSIKKYDTNFVNTATFNLSSSYLNSDISNYHQQLYYTEGANQALKTVDATTNQSLWTINSLGVNNSKCATDNSKVFFSKDQGNIVSYNHEGTLVRSYLSNELDYYAKHVFACGKYLVVNLEHNTVSTTRKTVIFEIASGIVKYVFTDNAECIQALSRSDNEIYLITTNNSGSSLIGNFNITTLNYNQPHTSTSKITSATFVDADNILFCTEDGNIKQFTYSNTNLITLLSGTNTSKLFFAEKSNRLYAAQAKNLVVYNKSAFALSFDKQYVSSDTIRNFHLIYNK
ncbi:MAG: hypothetical protein IPG89_03905 [Bacteroidetes bacterium]|nr:hypothetical protein [Bacteroidota bacterium]